MHVIFRLYLIFRTTYPEMSIPDQRVLLVQPFLREKAGAVHLMLDESKALAETLDWSVVKSICVGLNSYMRPTLFGSGKIEEIKAILAGNRQITAVFISQYKLTANQRIWLEDEFLLPVIDRYSLVLQIFQQHAMTMEAKLQVRLAEIPYMKNRLSVDYERDQVAKHKKGNLGEVYFERRQEALKQLQRKIERKVAKIKLQRQRLRQSKSRAHLPTVAVVGYTNCGKTSLIKALTGSKGLQPKDKLFATLDVTCHLGRLPSNLQCLFIDTVGFISDIPTALIASFSATLEDAIHSDLVIHVRDVSHPDTVNQNDQVLKTFKKLKIRLTPQNHIVVGNKIDKLDDIVKVGGLKAGGVMPVSATQNVGLGYLANRIDSSLAALTGRQTFVYRIRTGGREDTWLCRNATVVDREVATDQNYTNMTVLMNAEQRGKFHAELLKS